MRENGDGGGGVVTDVNRQRRTNSTDCGELERRSPPSVLLLWCVRDKKGRNEHSWAKYHGVLALRLFCCALCALYAKLDPKPKKTSVDITASFSHWPSISFFVVVGPAGHSVTGLSINWYYIVQQTQNSEMFLFFCKNCHQRDEGKQRRVSDPH